MTDTAQTQKVVINRCHGGFGLSTEAFEWLIENRGWQVTEWEDGNPADGSAEVVKNEGDDTVVLGGYSLVSSRRDTGLRTHSDLIDCIEALGSDADGRHAKLKIVEIPSDVEFTIEEYDGSEWVAEKHRTWK